MNVNELLNRIEQHLRFSGQSPSRFGRMLAGDPRLVFDLRRGRVPKPGLAQRLVAFLSATPRADCEVEQNANSYLIKRLIALLSPATVVCRMRESQQWASATFDGQRHRFLIAVSGHNATKRAKWLVREIEAFEFDTRAHLVADISARLTGTDWHVSPPVLLVEVEALTVAVDGYARPSARRSAVASAKGGALVCSWRRSSADSSRPINPEIESPSARASAASAIGS